MDPIRARRTRFPLGSAVLLCLLAWSASASAATYTVNSVNDVNDGICNTSHCSLREAIRAVNNTTGTHTINFEQPFGVAVGDFIIMPGSELPAITRDNVTIDGFDCLGCGPTGGNSGGIFSSGTSAQLAVAIDGSWIIASGNADEALLTLDAADISVSGINLRNGPANCVTVTANAVDAGFDDCFIGTDLTGLVGEGCASHGIYVGNGEEVNVRRYNVISDNGGDGIHITGPTADSSDLMGNIIGMTADLSGQLGNGGWGIRIENTAQGLSLIHI